MSWVNKQVGSRLAVQEKITNWKPEQQLLTQLLTMTTTHKFPSLDKVLAVRADRLQPDEKVAEILGDPGVGGGGTGAPLEVVHLEWEILNVTYCLIVC